MEMENLCLLLSIFAMASSSDQDYLVNYRLSGSEESTEVPIEHDFPNQAKIYQMHIKTNIINRFATTVITSKVLNTCTKAEEVTFSMIFPKNALITSFVMELDGKNYTSYILENEEARSQYDSAVSSGLGVARITTIVRDSHNFTVSVNMEPVSKAVFYLTYEELLRRTRGRYEHVINIRPGETVDDLSVEVFLSESRKLKYVKVPALRSGKEIVQESDRLNPNANIKIINATSAVIKFSPGVKDQLNFANLLNTNKKNGFAGQFVVHYDVEHDQEVGEILVRDGYFIHFFAPTTVVPLAKHLVFVLDTSASMKDGKKLTKLKRAMNNILNQLRREDLISLIEFNTDTIVWNLDNFKDNVVYSSGDSLEEFSFPNPYRATPANIKNAIKCVNKFYPDGNTDILSALEVSLRLVEMGKKVVDIKRQPLVMFLTDGEPNADDDQSYESIIEQITKQNSGLKKSPILTLSFGDGADDEFLQKLALLNMGISQHIYDALDSELQLECFYNQISAPLYTDITFKYDSSQFKNVSQTLFPVFYNGSELIITGQYDPQNGFNPPMIDVRSSKRPHKREAPVVQNSLTDISRLWAHVTVKELFDKIRVVPNKTEELQEKIIDLALTYSFITALSTMVIVKPNQEIVLGTKELGEAPIPSLNSNSSRLNRTKVEFPLDKNLNDALPWLNNIYNKRNGMLKLSTGNYKLGSTETVIGNSAYSSNIGNLFGKCTLLRDCPVVYPLLKNVEAYEARFCLLEKKYAGVFCMNSPVSFPQMLGSLELKFNLIP